jgi:hypothetical protein
MLDNASLMLAAKPAAGAVGIGMISSPPNIEHRELAELVIRAGRFGTMIDKLLRKARRQKKVILAIQYPHPQATLEPITLV